MSSVFEEHDYIGLSEVSKPVQASDNTIKTAFTDKITNTKTLNFKATELRLGLPGSESPERKTAAVIDEDVDNNGDFISCKISLVSGAKRAFSDAINGGSNKWGLSENGGSDTSSNNTSSAPTCLKKNVVNDNEKLHNSSVAQQDGAPAIITSSKAQAVGWPPIRSFRKNSMAINAKTDDNKDSKTDSGCLFVKVSMDGAPYLRKINLQNYGGYFELSVALEKMFSGFTMGQVDFSKGRLMDNLRHSEYVLTYEDKDADWMLVGDVPWKMFKESCKRMRIMKSSDAVGLASKASEE